MSHTTLPVALLSLLLLGAGEDEPKPIPPPIGIEALDAAGARVVSAVLPGPVVDYVFLPEGGGRLLVRTVMVDDEDDWDEDGQSQLVMIALGDEPKLEVLDLEIEDNPGRLFAAHLGGSSREALLGGRDGVHAISFETGASRRILDHGLLERPETARFVGSERWVDPVQIELGSLATVELGPDGLVTGPALALPMRARRSAAGLLLDSAEVTAVPRAEGGPLYLVAPETHGQRLRTVILDPSAGEDERVTESWARLPGPEEVQYSWYARIHGRLRLIVATKNAERMGIFEKMALRVFPIISDRTRGGRGALLKAETETIWWNEMDVQLADVDGDGLEEMVVLQPDGLSGEDLKINAYSKGPSTGFAFGPRKSQAKEAGSCWDYGSDVDGDGHPDLVVKHSDYLYLHPGIGHKKKKAIVEKKSTRSLALPDDSPERLREVSVGTGGADASERDESGCGLRVIDVEGNDRKEILTLTRDRGRGRLRIIELR